MFTFEHGEAGKTGWIGRKWTLFAHLRLIFRREARRRLRRDVLGYCFGLSIGSARRSAQSSLANEGGVLYA